MELQSLSTYYDLFEYIKKHSIQNIDIRFLDQYSILRSLTLNAANISTKLFTSEYFQFHQFRLLGININRVFRDPFLTQPTLVFFTNILLHKERIAILRQQPISDPPLINFTVNPSDNNSTTYNYAPPSYDTNRNFRDEIVGALKSIKVNVTMSFNKEDNDNIIGFQCNNCLELLDNIEKIKYVILMTARIFNVTLDTNKGIFNQSCLLTTP